MGKTASEILKILIASILSIFMTVVILSGTVINKKADKSYVEKEDLRLEKEINKVESDYKLECEKLKAEYIREVDRMNQIQEDMQKDIKKILEKL